ncbi:MAG: L-threonylcarbamoyladenylate synthase [Andreesenia angusta]|nr:L-threonylcarbamoyladenylate synthase [Andreesenia angusta]
MKKTKIIKSENLEENLSDIVKTIKSGGLVVFPTETVYGIGADALNTESVSEVFKAKERPRDNPLIVHISNESQLNRIVEKIPLSARKVMEKFWPGPITLIFNKKLIVPDVTSGNLETVAIRMPSNKIAREIIEASDTPLAAPSANISGKPSPTNVDHVVLDLFGKVDIIIDGGSTEYGIESTVLDFTGEKPIILRPGSITKEDLETVLNEVDYDSSDEKAGFRPKSPGQKYRHYSPKSELKVFAGENRENIVSRILKEEKKCISKGMKLVILTVEENKERFNSENIISLGSIENYSDIAKNLFEALRRCDMIQPDLILSEGFENKGVGRAIMNRLEKASGGNIEKV